MDTSSTLNAMATAARAPPVQHGNPKPALTQSLVEGDTTATVRRRGSPGPLTDRNQRESSQYPEQRRPQRARLAELGVRGIALLAVLVGALTFLVDPALTSRLNLASLILLQHLLGIGSRSSSVHPQRTPSYEAPLQQSQHAPGGQRVEDEPGVFWSVDHQSVLLSGLYYDGNSWQSAWLADNPWGDLSNLNKVATIDGDVLLSHGVSTRRACVRALLGDNSLKRDRPCDVSVNLTPLRRRIGASNDADRWAPRSTAFDQTPDRHPVLLTDVAGTSIADHLVHLACAFVTLQAHHQYLPDRTLLVTTNAHGSHGLYSSLEAAQRRWLLNAAFPFSVTPEVPRGLYASVIVGRCALPPMWTFAATTADPVQWRWYTAVQGLARALRQASLASTGASVMNTVKYSRLEPSQTPDSHEKQPEINHIAIIRPSSTTTCWDVDTVLALLEKVPHNGATWELHVLDSLWMPRAVDQHLVINSTAAESIRTASVVVASQEDAWLALFWMSPTKKPFLLIIDWDLQSMPAWPREPVGVPTLLDALPIARMARLLNVRSGPLRLECFNQEGSGVVGPPSEQHKLSWHRPSSAARFGRLKWLVQAATETNADTSSSARRWLLYAPWEQLGNQLLGLASACATADVLNRTLVIPPLGHRLKSDDAIVGVPTTMSASVDADGYRLYDPAEFRWKSATAYLDLDALEMLPCDWVDQDAFLGLIDSTVLAAGVRLWYHHITGGTTLAQIRRYYEEVAGIPVSDIRYFAPDREYEVSDSELLDLLGANADQILALGSMFRFHNFGVDAPRPQRTFLNLVKASQRFSAIQRSLLPRRALRQLADTYRLALLAETDRHETFRPFVCLHLRRQDHRAKCRHLDRADHEARQRCLSPLGHVEAVVSSAVAQGYSRPVALYLATDWRPSDALNEPNVVNQIQELGKANGAWDLVGWSGGLVYQRLHLLQLEASLSAMDPIELALLDQHLCSAADLFVGNAFSSFSAAIFYQRTVLGRPYTVV